LQGQVNFCLKRAAELRSRHTFAEELLWNYLRAKPFGFKFRRQHPYSNYILDFYCHALKLVIEADGSVHEKEEVKQNDAERQKQLEEPGLTFLRFTNNEIKLKPEKLIHQIEQRLQSKIRPL
jgi:imidazole glycerol-phosphate synthase subunit HisF